MTRFIVGRASIARIEETYLSIGRVTFSLNTPTESRPSTAIGCPHHYDPDRDLIKLSVHSWLLTIVKMNILIDFRCAPLR